MTTLNLQLQEILEAKENRAKIRTIFSEKNMATLSLSFNIPAYPKNNELIQLAFDSVVEDLKYYLIASRISIFDELTNPDKAGPFFIVGLTTSYSSLIEIKKTVEKFEINHQLERIIDVDVFDAKGIPISSNKQKKCFLCSQTAAKCIKEQTHNYKELQSFTFNKIESFTLQKKHTKITHKLSEIAMRALLYEVSLSPKPGLVDFINTGSHQDMNYYTFLNSTAAISPFWIEFANAGLNYNDDLLNALNIIRQIGLKAEKAMFEATNKVNTQKGLIFLIGISVFATAYILKNNNKFENKLFTDTIKIICNNIIENELSNSNKTNPTHGEKTFQKYGLKGAGIRYEAQFGFPIVFNNILPYLQENLNNTNINQKEQIEETLTNALLQIISELNDSNVLYRKGIETAEKLKQLAKKAITDAKYYKKLCLFCKKENISPGGSADILALAIFLYFVKTEINY